MGPNERKGKAVGQIFPSYKVNLINVSKLAKSFPQKIKLKFSNMNVAQKSRSNFTSAKVFLILFPPDWPITKHKHFLQLSGLCFIKFFPTQLMRVNIGAIRELFFRLQLPT
jgi:hypothetical protein